jgi:transcriptional regulator with XRE-family HTH domain
MGIYARDVEMKPITNPPAGGLSKRPPDQIDVHVGNRVRVRRMMIGLSQERLGEKLGLTFQQVQKYEKGANRISASRLFRIAEVLNVPVAFFFDGVPGGREGGEAAGFQEDSPTPYMLDFIGTPEGLQLNRAFTRIADPAVRRHILNLVKSLAGPDDGPADRTEAGPAPES